LPTVTASCPLAYSSAELAQFREGPVRALDRVIADIQNPIDVEQHADWAVRARGRRGTGHRRTLGGQPPREGDSERFGERLRGAACATLLAGMRASRYARSQVPDAEPPDDPDQSPADEGPNIMIPPEEFAGKWANAAAIARTPHEFTLDFMRIGPQGQQGMVVSRVSFSPLLASQLLDLLGEQWQAYTEESGIPPERERDD
jgi:hypothetical protein